MTPAEIDGAAFTAAAAQLRARFPELADELVDAAWRRASAAVLEDVRAAAGRHGSRVAREIQARATGQGTSIEIRIGPRGPLTHLIVGGVRPHPIDAVRPMPIGGVHGFASRVRHPGVRADPFVERGIDQAMPAVAAIIDDAGAELAGELARIMEG